MNQELKAVVGEICSLVANGYRDTKVYQELNYSPVPENLIDGLVKYGDTTITDLICLVRIERLFDLKLIDENQKERLIYIYNEYKELEANKKLLGENKLLYDKYNLIKQKFIELGIIEEFNYEDAFINEIDTKLKSKFIKR